MRWKCQGKGSDLGAARQQEEPVGPMQRRRPQVVGPQGHYKIGPWLLLRETGTQEKVRTGEWHHVSFMYHLCCVVRGVQRLWESWKNYPNTIAIVQPEDHGDLDQARSGGGSESGDGQILNRLRLSQWMWDVEEIEESSWLKVSGLSSWEVFG